MWCNGFKENLILTNNTTELFRYRKLRRYSETRKNTDHAQRLIDEAQKNISEAKELLIGIKERSTEVYPLHRQGELFFYDSQKYDKKLSRLCLQCLVETI
jgi:hypothetical protein